MGGVAKFEVPKAPRSEAPKAPREVGSGEGVSPSPADYGSGGAS